MCDQLFPCGGAVAAAEVGWQGCILHCPHVICTAELGHDGLHGGRVVYIIVLEEFMDGGHGGSELAAIVVMYGASLILANMTSTSCGSEMAIP